MLPRSTDIRLTMQLSALRHADIGRMVFKRRNLSDRLTVFFADRHSCGPSPRGDFGGAFSARYRLNSVVVQPNAPDWYQDDFGRMMTENLRQIIADFRHVTLAGAGMGAYGALLTAQRLKVDHVIAVRPIASLDPAKVPVGHARRADLERLGRDIEPVITHRAERYTVFAGRAADRAHLRRLYLPRARLTLHGLDRLDRTGCLRLPEPYLARLLGQPVHAGDLAAIA